MVIYSYGEKPKLVGERPPPTKERPKCLACRRALRAVFRDIVTVTEEDRETADGIARVTVHRITGKQWTGYGDGSGFFCGPKCGYDWALVVAKRLQDEGRQLVLVQRKD